MKPQNALIVGGSSGLGLELSLILAKDFNIHVTGRKDPYNDAVVFHNLWLDNPLNLTRNLDRLIEDLPKIDLIIYAAGFYQEGRISELKDEEIQAMDSIGLLAPALLIKRLLLKQQSLPGFIVVTSTSQWTPRELEPVYTATKAALGMFANSLSLDPRVGKVLVVGPAGMDTKFWRNKIQDTSEFLDPKWVAEQILDLYSGNFEYKFAKIMRKPPKVEVVETR